MVSSAVRGSFFSYYRFSLLLLSVQILLYLFPRFLVKPAVFVVIKLILFGDLFDRLAGIADGDDTGRDILSHDAARPDHSVVADMDAREKHGVRADPDVVPDRDGDPVFKFCVPYFVMDRVPGGDHGDVRAEHDVIPDLHLGDVNNDTPAVGVKIVADLDMFSVIAAERRLDVNGSPVPDTEKLEQEVFLRRVERKRAVKGAQQQLRLKLFR